MPDSPPNFDGWKKLPKAARHHLPVEWSGELVMGHVNLVRPAQGKRYAFKVLGPIEDAMELGCSKEPSP